jgi:hypothetical protein
MKRIFLFILFLMSSFLVQAQEVKSKAEQLVEAQLKAYNERNIDEFVKPFSDSVKVYMYPNQFLYQGKETMHKNYAVMFSNNPDLHCKLLNRMVLDNTVIDHEEVTFIKGKKKVYAIAIYKIKDDKIAEVTFIYPERKKSS